MTIRHGESTANTQHLVVSDPAVACIKYGLTAKGEMQAKQSADCILKLISKYNFSLNHVYIYYSDFKRTTETAHIIYQQLSAKHLIPCKLLRERRFGELDKNDGKLNYQIIWKYDRNNPNHTKYGVESVNHTLYRIKQFIEQIEQTYYNPNDKKLIIIVSHGDICQITHTLFANIAPQYHHDLDYIQNAQVRDLTLIANNKQTSKL